MIPRRAYFFWEGRPMSWLRRQSIVTFGRLHPDWEVRIIDGTVGKCPIPLTGNLSIIHRSDWARYRVLCDEGGVYFDTDMIFCRPIPDEFLAKDMMLPTHSRDIPWVSSIAALGAAPKQLFFQACAEKCNRIAAIPSLKGYQAYGVNIMEEMRPHLIHADIFWYDGTWFLPVPWNQVEDMWNSVPQMISPLTHAVHWFGGDPLSKELERTIDEDWMRGSKCLVARAWQLAMGSAEAETLTEQHGLA